MARRGKNEGSIYKKKNGTWRALISLDSKRVSFTAKTRAECHDWLRKMLDQIDQGMTYKGRQLTLKAYLCGWIETKKNSLRPKPAQQYERLIRTYIIPGIGHIKLQELTLRRINIFYSHLSSKGKGTRTIRYIHSILHAAIEQAVKEGILGKNPAHGAILPRQSNKEMGVLTEQQVTQFLITANQSRYRSLYHLAIVTGMRQSELLGLKWADIDWIKGSIKVRRQAQTIRGQGIVFLEPKTRASIRSIVVGEGVLQELGEHRYQQQKTIQFADSNWQDFDLIFCTKKGTPISQRNLLRDFHRVLEKAGLQRIRFHDLRHTAASLMINHGVPIVVVSKILGHSKPSVTLNIYAHCITELQSEAAKIMEEITTSIPIDTDNFDSNMHPIAPNCTQAHS